MQVVRCAVLAAVMLVFSSLHLGQLARFHVSAIAAVGLSPAPRGDHIVLRRIAYERHLEVEQTPPPAPKAPPVPTTPPAPAVPKPTAEIPLLIWNTFAPLGPQAQSWALRVAYCESRYHPTSVNSSSGAMGLFQFLPSTWAFTPYASQSAFDPVANTKAALWLYQRDGPSQWSCK